MTFKNKKNSKYLLSILIFSILFVGLKFIINKYDYCLTLIKFDLMNEKLNRLDLDSKKNILLKIDNLNQKIPNYFRFTHDIVGTYSKNGQCEKNTNLIVDNLEIYKQNKDRYLIESIDQIEKVDIKNILFLLFFIFALSSLKFLQYLIIFFKKEVRF